MDRIQIRATFSKKNRAKYISHLDLNRTMQRAFKRANIPVWYTEGFNPHAYIMFPLALSLGVNSDVEIMDFYIIEEMDFDKIQSNLNAVLPGGLQINKVDLQKDKHTAIAFSEYKIIIEEDNINSFNDIFDEFLNQDVIEIEKKTKKKGISVVDIKKYIDIIQKNVNDKTMELLIRLPAGTKININPSLIFEAFEKYKGFEINVVNIERTAILNQDHEIFS